MIKASALLIVLAIGLLVAGVLASSLLMVYVSIGVCAVAALLLAAGVFSHWSEIFGRREARPASRQGVWSEPQVHVTGPVLASLQAVAAARESGSPGSGEADVRPVGERSGSERSQDHPAGVDQPQAEVGGRIDEFRTTGRSDDLWERVEEELGSPTKRDTGALSWPSTAFPPVPPGMPVPAESAASASAEAADNGAAKTETGGTSPKSVPAEPAGQGAASQDAAADKPTSDDATADEPAADEPAADKPADQEPADQEPAAQESASDAADAEEPTAKEPAAQGERPQGIVPAPAVRDPSVPSATATDSVATESVVTESPAEDAEADGTGDQDPQAQDSEAQESEDPKAEDAAADGPAAPEPPAQQPAADEPAAKPPAGEVEVTVVPGVARYHRSECILIRFLGAGDLELMTRQEAEQAEFAACRACQPDRLEG